MDRSAFKDIFEIALNGFIARALNHISYSFSKQDDGQAMSPVNEPG